MDSKQFDELVARLASGQSRREALKGVAGGTLAAIGVTAVDADSEAKRKGKGKGKNRHNKNRGGDHRGKGAGDQKANAEKKKKKKCKKKPKDTICHNGQTITISHCALNSHLSHGDTLGPCYG